MRSAEKIMTFFMAISLPRIMSRIMVLTGSLDDHLAQVLASEHFALNEQGGPRA